MIKQKSKRCEKCGAVLTKDHTCGDMKPQTKKRTVTPIQPVRYDPVHDYSVATTLKRAKALSKSYKHDAALTEEGSDNYITLTKRGIEQKKGLRDVQHITIKTATGIQYEIELATLNGEDALFIRKVSSSKDNSITVYPASTNSITLV